MPTAATDACSLSVVVPAYHIAGEIAGNLQRLGQVLEKTGDYEILAVCDGDDAVREALVRADLPRVRVLAYPENRGKGFAIRYGLREARGDVCGFIDADMEIDPVSLPAMAARCNAGADVVLGSKRHPKSQVSYPILRRVQSAGFQLMVRVLFGFNVRDTQTGLKVMSREVRDLFVSEALVDRFAVDVELLALARRHGLKRFIEAPVRIDHRFGSTTNVGSIVEVFRDTFRIFFRLRVAHRYRPGVGEQALERELGSMGAAGVSPPSSPAVP